MPKNKKPEEILELENLYNIQLNLLEDNKQIILKKHEKIYICNKKNQVIKLNLQGCNIHKITGLYKFIHLTHLDLSNNPIENIENLEHLQNLTDLNLSCCSIEKIEGLEFLQNLMTLDLSSNHISKIENLDSLTELMDLNLSYNKIQRIEGLTSLVYIDELNLSGNSISKIENLGNLGRIEELNLSGNLIENLEGLEKLVCIEFLDLSHNLIQNIDGLENLIRLESISLSSNQIKYIKGLNTLKRLETIHLNSNNIEKIEGLETLANIEELELGNNQIQKIEGLTSLRKLKSLNLSINKIQKIEELDNLEALEALFLAKNLISKIENLDNLSLLKYLRLDFNLIEKIENLSNLINLIDINLSRNLIEKIENLGNLNMLQSLSLTSNKISNLEGLRGLKRLEKLYLGDNYFTSIELLKPILDIYALKYLEVNSNTFLISLGLKLKSVENHLDTIRNELQKLEGTKQNIKLPVKVMLLGNHGSGKSTFLEYFQTNEIISGKESTHILNIEPYPKDFDESLPEAIFFDFGGQDYYHGIYQAFLTLDSISLLFWKNSTDSNCTSIDSKGQSTIHFNRKYWLGQLDFAFNQRKKYFQDTTQESIFAVQTHAESDNQSFFNHPSISQSFYISLQEQTLKHKSALVHLKELLQETISEQSKSVEKTENEIRLYKHILKQKNSHWTQVEELKNIYNTEINFLKAELEQLAMKGLLLYYKHIPALEDVVWLNPSATVKMIHEEILNDTTIREAKGQVDKNVFEEKVADVKIIEMLKENKVIFLDKYSDTPKYIIAGYLPAVKEDNDEYFIFGDFNNADLTLKFENFIPFGFMNQLICHFGKNPEKKTYRKDLLIFTTNNRKVKVLIHLDFENLEIKLFIKTFNKEVDIKTIQSDLFFNILQLYWENDVPEDTTYDDAMAEASKRIYKHNKKDFTYEFVERISSNLKEERTLNNFEIAPEDMYISLGSNNFIHYKTLENVEETKGEIIVYQKDKNGDLDKTKAKTISTVAFKHLSKNPNLKQMKKIFISYSRKDVDFKDELKKHLKMLKIFDIADAWSCEEITIGKWDSQIQKELEESDLIIYMLSANFFSSRYILEKEVQKGIEIIESNKSKNILCVIVSDFIGLDKLKNSVDDRTDLQDAILKLNDYQYLPYEKIENKVTGNTEEKIISLKEYSNSNNLEKALTQITDKVLEFAKSI